MDNINKTIDETTNIENEPVLSCLKHRSAASSVIRRR